MGSQFVLRPQSAAPAKQTPNVRDISGRSTAGTTGPVVEAPKVDQAAIDANEARRKQEQEILNQAFAPDPADAFSGVHQENAKKILAAQKKAAEERVSGFTESELAKQQAQSEVDKSKEIATSQAAIFGQSTRAKKRRSGSLLTSGQTEATPMIGTYGPVGNRRTLLGY